MAERQLQVPATAADMQHLMRASAADRMCWVGEGAWPLKLIGSLKFLVAAVASGRLKQRNRVIEREGESVKKRTKEMELQPRQAEKSERESC